MRQKAVLVFTPKIKLLLVAILARILYKIGSFRMASFRLGLREVAPSSMWWSDTFLNTITGRMRLIYIKRIIIKYKCKVFKATLPIYKELLLYILYTTHSIRLGNWARYSAIALIVQKNSYNFIPKAYVLQVLSLMPYYKRLKTKWDWPDWVIKAGGGPGRLISKPKDKPLALRD